MPVREPKAAVSGRKFKFKTEMYFLPLRSNLSLELMLELMEKEERKECSD